MSALTSSIASRWSGVSVNGKRSSNSRCQSPSGANAWPLRRRRSAYSLSSSPASSCAARRARAFIVSQRVPPSFESGGARRPPRADVARDLRELVGGHEDAVVALVFEVQVVARDAGDGARLEAREARDAVVLVDDDVAGAQVGERAQRAPPARRPTSAVAAAARRGGGAAAGARGRRRASAAAR